MLDAIAVVVYNGVNHTTALPQLLSQKPHASGFGYDNIASQ